jgi:hypothetical protein
MNTRTLKLAANGLGQFFVHIYCADYSVCAEGPFASYEEAAAAMKAIEDGSYWAGCFSSED